MTVKAEKKKKIVKTIKIDVDKCNGCRACEVICSAFHAAPKYSSNNPARSRIRVIRDPLADIYVPVYAGEYAAPSARAETNTPSTARNTRSAPSAGPPAPRGTVFKEPDSGLPLKCDMCEATEANEPLCVSGAWRMP